MSVGAGPCVSEALTKRLRVVLAGRPRRLRLDDHPAVVPAARRADAVRELRLVAMRTLDERRQGEGEVAPPVHLPRVSDLSLRHTHVGLVSWGSSGGRTRDAILVLDVDL